MLITKLNSATLTSTVFWDAVPCNSLNNFLFPSNLLSQLLRMFPQKRLYQFTVLYAFKFLTTMILIITSLRTSYLTFNPLNPELNPICYLLALLGAHHYLYVSRIRVKLLTFRLLMSYIYIYGALILDVSRSHTTTQHSR